MNAAAKKTSELVHRSRRAHVGMREDDPERQPQPRARRAPTNIQRRSTSVASVPTSSDPSGTSPSRIIEYTEIARPRMSSGESVCSRMFEEPMKLSVAKADDDQQMPPAIAECGGRAERRDAERPPRRPRRPDACGAARAGRRGEERAADRANARRRHQPAKAACVGVQHVHRIRRQQEVIRPDGERGDDQQQHDPAQHRMAGKKRTPSRSPPATSPRCVLGGAAGFIRQRQHHGQRRDRVDQHARRDADPRDQQSRQRRPDDARRVERNRVHPDRVADELARHQQRHPTLARRRVERLRRGLQAAE